jgi:cytochrome c553
VTKICNKCHKEKVADVRAFYAAKNNSDGLMGHCIQCHNKAARANREKRKQSAAGLKIKYLTADKEGKALFGQLLSVMRELEIRLGELEHLYHNSNPPSARAAGAI